jgi:hypothetical protein
MSKMEPVRLQTAGVKPASVGNGFEAGKRTAARGCVLLIVSQGGRWAKLKSQVEFQL